MPYSTDALAGATILVGEDDYLLADTVMAAIKSAGGDVLGPFPSAAATLEALAAVVRPPDAAALNIQLVDGESYPVADELVRRDIPFVFASGNSAASIPARFARAPLVAKPYAAHHVVQALAAMLEPGETSRAT